MQYQRICKGIFRARPNRFIAHVEINGEEHVVHVKNTGRCRELLVPDAVVYLQETDNPKRKTQYDLIAVEKGSRLINIDSQAPNRVFHEWAQAGHFVPDLTLLKPESTYGNSRFDFYWEAGVGRKGFVEVKGATLEEDGSVYFPDAPTERGVKHIEELIAAVENGYEAVLCFVIQMQGVSFLAPNDRTHAAFGVALRKAEKAGVSLCAYDCVVTPEMLGMGEKVPIHL